MVRGGHIALLLPFGKCLSPVIRIEGRRQRIIGHNCLLVHQKWFKGLVFADGLFHCPALVGEFTPEAGSAAVLLAGEPAFHPALIPDIEALSSFEFR
jgi:hypothetical protein